jgi:tetratricopeptide (TPR) repeat protein
MKKAVLVLIFSVIISSGFAQNARDLYQKGKWEIRRGNLYSAIHFFKKALGVNPYYRQCYEGLARVYIRLNNYIEAYKNLKLALSYDERNVDNLVDMARVRAKLARVEGEVIASESYLRRAYSIEPRNKRVLIAYGDYFMARGFFDKAISMYRKGLLVDERDFGIYIKIAKSYVKKGDRHNTEKYLKLAEELNSRSEESNFELGNYYYNTKNYEKAEKYFKIAVSLNPVYKDALHYLVNVYFIKRDWENAISVLKTLRRLSPRDYLVYYKLGVASSSLGAKLNENHKVEQAIRYFNYALKNRVSDDITRLVAEETAVRHLRIGNRYRRALASYYLKIADLHIRNNLISRAIFALRRGVRLAPKNVRLRHRLANIYRKLGYIDRFYRELLLIKRDITTRNARVNDDLMFLRNRVVDTLAYKENIRQYEIDSPRPKIVISRISNESIYKRSHPGIAPVLKGMLYQAMKNKGNVNVSMLEDPNTSEENMARNRNADILLKGYMRETSDRITLYVKLVTISTGNTFARFSVTKMGNERITEAVIDIANRISASIPVFGRIIRLSGYIGIINVGRWHGFKKGDKFEIYKSARIVKDILSGYPVVKKSEVLGNLEIIVAGEKISRVQLNVSRYMIFNSINTNDIIVFKPKRNNNQRN